MLFDKSQQKKTSLSCWDSCILELIGNIFSESLIEESDIYALNTRGSIKYLIEFIADCVDGRNLLMGFIAIHFVINLLKVLANQSITFKLII